MFDSPKLAINGGKAVYPGDLKRGRVFGEEEKQAVLEVMDGGIVSRAGRGIKVSEFERAFADYHGVPFAIATTSGTTALHTAVESLGIKTGDEVIVPDLTFISTASAVLQTGANVVFCDIDEQSFNLSAEDLEKKITDRTKAVIVVHLYGTPADVRTIFSIVRKYNLHLIEDCAQAHGATIDGKIVGTFGDLGCFSFYQTKNMSCGEGGMIVTRNEELGSLCRSLVNHGIVGSDIKMYDYDKLGYNYQMTELQAAIGLVQLGKLEWLNQQRCRNARLYRKGLRRLNLRFQEEVEGSVCHCLTALLPDKFMGYRDRFLEAVRAEGALINCLYPLPLSWTKLFADYQVKPEVSQRTASLLFNLYTNPDVDEHFIRVCCTAIRKVFKSERGDTP